MKYTFHAEQARDNLVNEIRKLAEAQGFSRVVIGISGGKDSSVTAALCVRALGAENVYGVMLPDGEQKDISDSRRVCEALGIHARTVNIGKIHAALREATDQLGPAAGEGEFSVPPHRESDINVGPRLRMTVLRYIAQALGARLAGTGNLSEATVGYCTKDGDQPFRSHGGLLHQGRRHLLRLRNPAGPDQRRSRRSGPDHAGTAPGSCGKNTDGRTLRPQR